MVAEKNHESSSYALGRLKSTRSKLATLQAEYRVILLVAMVFGCIQIATGLHLLIAGSGGILSVVLGALVSGATFLRLQKLKTEGREDDDRAAEGVSG